MTGEINPSQAAPKGALILNAALFIGALSLLGGALAVNFSQRSTELEIAEDENRTLAQFPAPSWAAIADGSFATGVDEWTADHFPAREYFMSAHFWLEEHRGFRSEEQVAIYAVAIDTNADLDPLGNELTLEAFDSGDGVELEDELEQLGGEPDGESEQAKKSDPDSIEKSEGILVVDGRAMQLFSGGPDGSRRYAKVVNTYADALRGKVDIYSLIVPTAQTFYLPESYAGRVRDEPPNIDATYAMMDSSVKTVDVVGALNGHSGEYIYFRTDHHWTALGAYYAYAAFCQAAKLKPVALDKMKKKTIESYRGSLYSYTRDSKLGRSADTIEYWVPTVQVSVGRYLDAEQKSPYDGDLLRESSKGYGVFLGGDHPLLVARTNAKTGRHALVIKNSYGNPFAVFLVNHFDTVVIVDYRKYDGAVLDLVDEHQITDLIIVNGAITANAKFHIDRVGRLLDGGKAEEKKAKLKAAKAAKAGAEE